MIELVNKDIFDDKQTKVGNIEYCLQGEELYIASIYIDKNRRKEGLAGKYIKSLFADPMVRKITLDSASSARPFWRKIGTRFRYGTQKGVITRDNIKI